ncbi:MAG: chitobiase/beta-hexosaminidase C-terminal domain-containing protein [Terracidiphilus sp.]|jgi:glucosylceramidase
MGKRLAVLATSLAIVWIGGCGSGSGGGGGNSTPPAQQAATPTFSPAAGAYTSAQTVTLADTTTGATIYYTTNGSAPTETSSVYSTPIAVSSTTTVNAIAANPPSYLNSSVATAIYTINIPAAATPTFSPAPGTYTAAQSVTLSDTTTGAAIYYTTDGSTPTAASTLYSPSTPIAVSSTTTINAIAVASGYITSAVATGTYTINIPVVATPTFTPAPGSFTSPQSVTLSDATAGASIYYTTNGSAPTTSSTLYSPSSPIAVPSAAITIKAIAVAAGYTNSAVATGTYTIIGPSVSIVLSTDDETQLMAAQPTVNFLTGSTTDATTSTVVVDPTQQYQSIEGFGAAFTDSAAYLLMQVEPSASLPGTLNDLFTRNGNGIGLSFMRIPMGASDIAQSVYSYDDVPVGQTDPTLANFSIAHDQAYILPLIQQAKALNPQMKLMANPWSPPGWMKDPASMSPVSMLGGTLLMTTTDETAFANYFVKYIQAYQAAGVPIDYISLQNEPLNITTSYPSMGMSDTVQLSLLQNYVLPALASNSISTKVFVYDHNWDTPSYPQFVLSSLSAPQLAQVAGTAWHGYGGAPGAQQLLQNQFPTLGNWETEHSGGTWVSDQFASDMLEITEVLRNSAKSYVKWSLALNQNLGPDLTQNDPPLTGCNTCTPIVTVNSSTGAVTKDIEFYTLGHYSKYLLPGAVRVYSSNTPAIASVAFQNPDGSMALIAYNSTTTTQTFQVQWGTESFSYTLPATAAATFTWSGTIAGRTPPVVATAQIQGSSFSSESGLETEATGDSTGEYDLGYISQGAYTVYENVDFGASVSKVNLRTASAGNGGTATFYLDSMTSAPIATVTLPVTGGWQTWTTVSGVPVSGASGVHTLYVVFNGTTTSIANLNWFQFQ